MGIAPRQPAWEHRLDDPSEPLFTMAVVSELLGVDAQVIRRFDRADIMSTARPSGNQRRYSREDIALISYALSLADDGIPIEGIARILGLERRIAHLEDEP